MKTIIVDPSLCIQCCDCQIACKDEHVGNDWSPIAAPQEEGQFWIEIRESQCGSGTRIRQTRVPVVCQHCADAPCMAAAAAAGVPDAVYRREDGIVVIDPEASRGVRAIKEACPYGVVYWNSVLDIPQKCTMCAHLLDDGWERPRCVAACPRDALRYVDVEELAEESLYAPIEHLHGEYGTRPTVAYVNLPKPFVAGEACAKATGACLDRVEALAVKITEEGDNGPRRSAITNALGEFKVTDLEPGTWEVSLSAPGFEGAAVTVDLTADGAVNLGTVELAPDPSSSSQGHAVSFSKLRDGIPGLARSVWAEGVDGPCAVEGVVWSWSDGAPVPDAHLVLADAAAGRAWQAVSGEDGSFTFPGLPAGFYALAVDAAGFDRKLVEKIEVRGAVAMGQVRLFRVPGLAEA